MLAFAKDKALWERVRTSPDFERHRREVLEKYEQVWQVPTPALSYWQVVGEDDRDVGKILYNRGFQLYTTAILALIYPDNEEYYRRLVDTLWTYCNECTWAVGDFRDYYGVTRHDYFPGLIDIGSASLGMTLAEIKYLFSDRLPKFLIDRLTAELRRHIIDPYLNNRYFWEWHDNNWTSVCAGGVGVVLMYEDPKTFYAMKSRLDASMKCYLDSFAEDGVCVEGSAYWGFGFGFYANYAWVLREFTEGRINLFDNPKVKAIAQFMQKIILDDHTLVTFSDVNPTEGYWIGMPHMLKDVYGDEMEKLPADIATITVYQHFSFMLRCFIFYKPEYNATELNRNVTYVMKDKGWLTRRAPKYSFAAKGGHNGESHNHIDVGNFIFVHNDKQIICDMGAGSYSNGYHGKNRYNHFAPSAYAHNLPIFDGVGESHIMKSAVIIDYDEATEHAHCEFARAYNNPKVKQLDRSYDFKENGVWVTDEFDYEGDVIVERFLSAIPPVIVDGKIHIEDVVFTASDDIVPEIKIEKHHNHIQRPGWPEYTDVYCMDYTLPKGKRTFTLKVEVQ